MVAKADSFIAGLARPISVALVALCVTWLMGVPAATAGGRDTVHVIGDSVLLGAHEELRHQGFSVDAVEGRRPTRLPSALRRVESLSAPLVVHLGTNGPIPSDFCGSLVSRGLADHPVILVTITADREWTNRNNRLIRQCARELGSTRAAVVPWHVVAQVEPDLLAPDRVHLTNRGAEVLVQQICTALRRFSDLNPDAGKLATRCSVSAQDPNVSTGSALGK